MRTLKKVALAAIALAMLLPTAASAQNEVEASVQADLVSKYMWRGLDRGGISIQPQAQVSWHGLYAKARGSVGFDKSDEEEFDLELGYRLWGVNVALIDYWRTGIDAENRYLYYDRDDGPHRFEGNIGYTCKYFSLQGYTTFWGVDDTPYYTFADGDKTSHKRAYSTYIELGVPFSLGGIKWELQGGFSPFESAGTYVDRTVTVEGLETSILSKEYLYAEGAAFVKASLRATKELSFGDVRLPIFAEIHMNPYLQKTHFLFGLSVIPF